VGGGEDAGKEKGLRKCDQLPQAAGGPGLLAVDPF